MIVQDGIRRMYTAGFDKPEGDCFYYITLYNENYVMPAMPDAAAVPGAPELGTVPEGIVQGMYRFAPAPEGPSRRATIISPAPPARPRSRPSACSRLNGTAGRSCGRRRRPRLPWWEEALSVERSNRLHPSRPPEVPWVGRALAHSDGPVVAVTDFMKQVPEMIARWVPRSFTPLGTDGYGRSDTRAALRRHFEIDAAHIVVAALAALADQGEAKSEEVSDAIARYGIDADAPDPRTS